MLAWVNEDAYTVPFESVTGNDDEYDVIEWAVPLLIVMPPLGTAPWLGRDSVTKMYASDFNSYPLMEF